MDELRDLVRRAHDGDLEAYDALVRRFQDMAVGYAYSRLGDFHLAEDASQEAFLDAYQGLPALRDPAAFPGWFRKVVLTECERIRRGRPATAPLLETALKMASAEPGPAEMVEQGEMKEAIHRAIRTLPAGEREATSLFYMGEYSQNEIGQFLGVPVSTVKNRLRGARRRLRERMMVMVKDNLREQRPSRDEEFAVGVIDDLVELNDQEMNALLRQTHVDDAIKALKGASRAVKEKFLSSMSRRVRMYIEDEMEALEVVPPDEAEAARDRILEKASKLGEPPPVAERPEKELSEQYLSMKSQLRDEVETVSCERLESVELDELLEDMAAVARTEGLKGLDGTALACGDPFIRKLLLFAIDGTDPEVIREIAGIWKQTLLQHCGIRCDMVIRGTVAIRNGENPVILEARLKALHSAALERGDYRRVTVRRLRHRLPRVLAARPGFAELTELIVDMSYLASRRGVEALGELVDAADDAFFREAVDLVIDGATGEEIETSLAPRKTDRVRECEGQYEKVLESIVAIQTGAEGDE